MRNRTVLIAVTAALAAVTPFTLAAQKLGQGGTGVDDTTALAHCDTPLGVAALVDQKTANPTDRLSPQLQALMRMAEMQNGGSTATVDPLPRVTLMAACSGCFRVADRGDAFTASGSARKDIGVVGGGLLLGLGVGALGGTYGSTDIGKITSFAMLDAYRKLITDARPRLAARLRPAPQALPAPATSQPAVPSTAPRR